VIPAQPKTRFVILAAPRSGSELLVSLLDSHPAIRCDSELFKEPRLMAHRYLTGMSAARRAVWGFKVIDSQLRWQLNGAGADGAFLDRLVAEDGYCVFRLRRRDLLAQSLSFIDAGQSRYHFREGEERPEYRPLQVDPAELVSLMHGLDDNDRWAERVAARVPHVSLFYEDDLAKPEAQHETVNRLCHELGVAPSAATTDLVARAPADAWARVANPVEVAAALRTTRFAPLADALDIARDTGLE
jgi:LPS sulfotransferase NodH